VFRKADALLKAGKRKEYGMIDAKTMERMKHYFRESGVEELGFEITAGGWGYLPHSDTSARAYLEAMTYDREKAKEKPFASNYIVSKVVEFEVLFDAQKPLEAKASLFDVRGMDFNDVMFELDKMQPVLTRDWDLTHPIVSMREAFQQFEQYVFAEPTPKVMGEQGET